MVAQRFTQSEYQNKTIGFNVNSQETIRETSEELIVNTRPFIVGQKSFFFFPNTWFVFSFVVCVSVDKAVRPFLLLRVEDALLVKTVCSKVGDCRINSSLDWSYNMVQECVCACVKTKQNQIITRRNQQRTKEQQQQNTTWSAKFYKCFRLLSFLIKLHFKQQY